MLARSVLASAVLLAILLSTPAPALACIPVLPSFREAVHGSDAIAVVTVLERHAGRPGSDERYRMVRILKGDLPDSIRLARPHTNACHDPVGSLARTKRTPIVVAFGVSSFGRTIHPAWGFERGIGVHGSAGVPRGVDTMRELESAIRRELGLPDTSTALEPTPRSAPVGHPAAAVVIGGLVALVVALRTATRRRSLRSDACPTPRPGPSGCC
jgi:hypothetical protein